MCLNNYTCFRFIFFIVIKGYYKRSFSSQVFEAAQDVRLPAGPGRPSGVRHLPVRRPGRTVLELRNFAGARVARAADGRQRLFVRQLAAIRRHLRRVPDLDSGQAGVHGHGNVEVGQVHVHEAADKLRFEAQRLQEAVRHQVHAPVRPPVPSKLGRRPGRFVQHFKFGRAIVHGSEHFPAPH